MQPPPENFERARNVDLKTRWAGDPETWGQSVDLATVVTAGGAQVNSAQQCIRSQTRDLIAISWDLFASWSIVGVDQANDQFDLYLDFTLGAGRTTSRALWKMASKAAGAPPVTQSVQALALGWEPYPFTGYEGVAISGSPIVAIALNARALLSIKHSGGAADHPVTLTVNAQCCPRSWVP
jgi:hypothetical protein